MQLQVHAQGVTLELREARCTGRISTASTRRSDAGLEVAPIKGQALFFSNDRAHEPTGTLHGGAPVIEGEKWVAAKWLREDVFA